MRRLALIRTGSIAAFTYVLLVVAMSATAQFQVTSVVDTTPGQEGFGVRIPDNPDELGPGDADALNQILNHQVITGHFPTSTAENGTQIVRTLDISNLDVMSFIFDDPTPPTLQPLTMTQLSHVGGFDHFNFYQQITSLPRDVTASVTTANGGGIITPPLLDPILNSPTNTMFLHSERASRFDEVVAGAPTDGNLSYYNDDLQNALYYKKYTTNNSITFSDLPRLPAQYLNPSMEDDFWHFETDLVGVKADGTFDPNLIGPDIGTNLSWQSNVVFDSSGTLSGLVYSANPDPSMVPPASGGQISNIQIDLPSVPEPTGLLFLSAVVGVALLAGRRQR